MDYQNAQGIPFKIEWRGRNLELCPRVQTHKGEFEAWAKQTAIRQHVELRSVLPPDVWQADYEEIKRLGSEGFFHFDGEYCQRLLKMIPGQLKMLRLQLGTTADGMTDEDITEFMLDKFEELEGYFGMVQHKVDDAERLAGYDRKVEGHDPKNQKTPGHGDPKVLARELMKAGLY